MVKDEFSYSDLKDMAEVFAIDNESIALRIEVIKELCELVGIDWARLDIKILKYYAECPEHIPADSWMFKRAIYKDAGEMGLGHWVSPQDSRPYFKFN